MCVCVCVCLSLCLSLSLSVSLCLTLSHSVSLCLSPSLSEQSMSGQRGTCTRTLVYTRMHVHVQGRTFGAVDASSFSCSLRRCAISYSAFNCHMHTANHRVCQPHFETSTHIHKHIRTHPHIHSSTHIRTCKACSLLLPCHLGASHTSATVL